MALKKSISTEQGFNAPNSYGVVEEARYSKNGNSHIALSIFKDKTSRDEKKDPIKMFYTSFVYDQDISRNIIKQAYEFLKTLPEFSDAEDV